MQASQEQFARFTTADIPPQFLKPAFLVGHVPQRVLASDHRISYSMYVPPPPVYNARPSASDAKLPLLVFVHGTRRNLSAMTSGLDTFADSIPCAVVAPLFPAGLDGPADLDSYKLLRSATLRSDEALLAIIDEIALRYPGIETEKFYLMGFSGGGQFAHRFLYIHPERLAGVAPGAPGTVTMLNGSAKWPKGVYDVPAVFGKPIELDLVRQVPVRVFVGEQDITPHGGHDFWDWLDKVRANGSNKRPTTGHQKEESSVVRNDSRLDGLKLLVEDWQRHDIDCELVIVEGAAHENEPVRKNMLDFMRSIMHKKT